MEEENINQINNEASEADSDSGTPTMDMRDERSEIEKERDEYRAGWQRAKADFLNYKKEESKHLEDVVRYSSEGLIKELIAALHEFDLALKVIEKNGGSTELEKGVMMVRGKIESALKKRGLEEIVIIPGDPFDPAIAEGMIEVESDQAPGSVVQVLEPGYRLYDKVIQAVKVSISKDKE